MGDIKSLYVVFFLLEDEATCQLSDFRSEGRVLESGDLMDVDVGLGSGLESGILLGCGETEDDARAASRNYLKRLAKWHGVEDVRDIHLFGKPLSQTQHLLDNDPLILPNESSQDEPLSETQDLENDQIISTNESKDKPGVSGSRRSKRIFEKQAKH